MHDNALKYTLEVILVHISKCEERFANIKIPEDFTATESGEILLDSIATRLQAIGENIKKLLKFNPNMATKYPQVHWNEVVRFRDFISHHYEKLDYQIVYEICNDHLPKIKLAIESELKMIN